MLIFVSTFMKQYWWLLLKGMVGAWYAYWQARHRPAGRLWIDTMKLRIPAVGNLIKKASISRFAITFSTLLESGLPVLEALRVVKRVVDNELLANTLEMVRQKIAEGADIATPLKQSKVFPPIVGYMIGVGEESGRLEELLKKTAEAYDEEIEIAAQKLTALLEPFMIVIMQSSSGLSHYQFCFRSSRCPICGRPPMKKRRGTGVTCGWSILRQSGGESPFALALSTRPASGLRDVMREWTL
jgi:type II secretory pathway component PulF